MVQMEYFSSLWSVVASPYLWPGNSSNKYVCLFSQWYAKLFPNNTPFLRSSQYFTCEFLCLPQMQIVRIRQYIVGSGSWTPSLVSSKWSPTIHTAWRKFLPGVSDIDLLMKCSIYKYISPRISFKNNYQQSLSPPWRSALFISNSILNIPLLLSHSVPDGSPSALERSLTISKPSPLLDIPVKICYAKFFMK